MGWTTGQTHQTNTPSPQQAATWQILMQQLLGRYNQGPYSFNEFRAGGGEPRPYPSLVLSPDQAHFIDPQQVNPYIALLTQAKGSAVPPATVPPATGRSSPSLLDMLSQGRR